MKISARNVLKGKVKSVDVGVVNAEIVIEIAPGIEVTSVITKKSSDSLGIEIGKETFVIIKASNVMLGIE